MEKEIDWSFKDADKEYVEFMTQKREAILLNKLKELGLEHLLEDEHNRRFPCFKKEVQRIAIGHEIETIYYNDNSIKGMVVVAIEIKINTTFTKEGVQMSTTIQEIETPFKMSDLIGSISKKSGREMLYQVSELRKEWEVNTK